jgi:hypothetical protein
MLYGSGTAATPELSHRRRSNLYTYYQLLQ